jgi:Zn-dependent protease with chaperone function
MTLPYLFKLLCLCLASFLLVHLALAIAVGLATPAAVRIAARIRPVLGARFLLFLRMLPAGLGGFIVAGLCVPSYMWLEPETATGEGVGSVCLALSVLTLALWAVSMGRAVVALTRSFHYLRHCQRTGLKMDLSGERLPAWVVEEPVALFAIAGVFRPRLLVSRRVIRLLSRDQLTAALRHERAHLTSRDNLKRLMLVLAPGMLPFIHGFARLERGWAIYTERAADDQAVGGDASRSLSLATALVRVSRLGTAPSATVLATPLLADDDLPGRVERLLNAPPRAEANVSWMGCLVAGAAVMLSGAVIAVGLQPAFLYPVHRVLEHLIR